MDFVLSITAAMLIAVAFRALTVFSVRLFCFPKGANHNICLCFWYLQGLVCGCYAIILTMAPHYLNDPLVLICPL